MSQIPVSELYLFNHGMGFIIRKSEVNITPEEENQINFKIKNNEINDVLKSLLINIQDCTVKDITYKTPIKEESTFELSKEGTISSLIKNNIGLSVKIQLLEEKELIEGRLVSIQNENFASHIPKSFSILTETGLNLISLKNVESLELNDNKLLDEFQKYISNSTLDYDKEREIVISFKPEKESNETNVILGYLIQMPVWKLTYRLRILSDNTIRLFGWAIIENETTDDWAEISLKLISGNPISFVYDLGKELTLARSDFTPEPPKASGPVVAQASLKSEESQSIEPKFQSIMGISPPGRPPMPPAGGAPPPLGSGAGAPKPPMPPGGVARSTNIAEMRTGMLYQLRRFRGTSDQENFDQTKNDDLMNEIIASEIDEVAKDISAGSDYYVFSLNTKITIPGKEKSLIPLINESLNAKKILYHKNIISKPSPYQGIQLTNNTEFPFEQGPVMVFSDDHPVGQSILEYTSVGQDQILTYALEDRVRIQYSIDETKFSEFAYSIQRDKKLLVKRRFNFVNVKIRVFNFLTEDKDLLIDYYSTKNLILIPEKVPSGVEISKKENFFRYKIALENNSIQNISIPFKEELTTTVDFNSMEKQLILDIPDSDVKGEAKVTLISFIEYQAKYKSLLEKRNQIETKLKGILGEEMRIRENLVSLSDRKEDERARTNFIVKLDDLFEESLKLQKDKKPLTKELALLHENMEKLLDNLKLTES